MTVIFKSDRSINETFKTNFSFIVLFTAIEQEKEKQNLIAGIENFDTKKLKHTETQEKNPLPTKEG
jgi:hypothetical protein